MKSHSENKQRTEHMQDAENETPGRMAGYGGRDAEKLEQNLKATSKGKQNYEEEE